MYNPPLNTPNLYILICGKPSILVVIDSSAKTVSVCHSLPLQINFPNCFVMNLTQFAAFPSLHSFTFSPSAALHRIFAYPQIALATVYSSTARQSFKVSAVSLAAEIHFSTPKNSESESLIPFLSTKFICCFFPPL